jgi:ATP-dependent exoDNAse (exonuclease V) beta subunit
MQKLLVYRSSAGSGKTYTLVKTYLSLLFKIKSNFGFKQILAITFTNKAAEEMKKRVLTALDEISSEGKKNKLAIEISKENNFDIAQVVERSKEITQKILHNYKDFNLMTIDKFTNKVIRSFSKELGISNNYNIILEENEFLEDVISKYIDEISKNKNQLEILEKMIEESIELGVNNNIERQLNKLKRIIFKSNSQFINPMNVEEIANLRSFVNQGLNISENKLKDACRLGQEILLDHQIPDEWFPYRRVQTVFNSIDKFSNLSYKDIEKWNSWLEKDQWFKKSLSKSELATVNIIYDSIITQIKTIVKETSYRLKLIEVHKFLVPFSMVQSLIERINIEKSAQNSILISDFNDLVSDIIKNEPAGFIFEKIGSKYQYILIDEFQDTSTLQWNNLIPLVHESLSVGGQNLIVGDAKQAIYRWRNGNVGQFIDLPKIHDTSLKNNYESLFNNSFIEKELDNNWRSAVNIVEFNNWFFTQVVKELDIPSIQKAYTNLKQDCQRDFKGLVSIDISEKSEFDLDLFLKSNILNAIDSGYSFKDISILVRSKKDALKIINSLLVNKVIVNGESLDIPFVSEDSLFLNTSLAYKILVSAFNYFEFREKRELLILNHFLENYFSKEYSSLEVVMTNIKTFDFEYYSNFFDFEKLSFVLNILHLNPNDPFVDFFMNLSNNLILKENFSMVQLLDYFEQKASKLSVESAPKNAIQILTVHKSKGLEFPVVIVPYTNWGSKSNVDIPYTWVENVNLEDRNIDLYIGEMSNRSLSHLDKKLVYEIEEKEVLLDTLNLYYVAFTRAIDQLYVSFENSEKKANLPNLLAITIKDHLSYNKENNQLLISNQKEKVSELDSQVESVSKPYNLIFDNDNNYYNNIHGYLNFSSRENFGTFFHNVISKVYSNFSDGFDYLDSLSTQPNLDKSYIDRTKTILNELQKNKSLSFIYDSNQIIYNEREFRSSDNEILRLDRLIIKDNHAIIIDYKTSKGENDTNQVSNYLSNVKLCGFNKVSAFLLYVSNQELVEVTS